MVKRAIQLFIFLLITVVGYAQNNITVTGTVTDEADMLLLVLVFC